MWILIASAIGILFGIVIMAFAWGAHDTQAKRRGYVILEDEKYYLLSSRSHTREDQPGDGQVRDL